MKYNKNSKLSIYKTKEITYFNLLLATAKVNIIITEIIKYKAATEATPARAPILSLQDFVQVCVVTKLAVGSVCRSRPAVDDIVT